MKKGKTANAKKRRLGSKSKTRSSTDQYVTATPPVPSGEEVESEERIVPRKRRCQRHREQEKAMTTAPASSYGRAGKVIGPRDCIVNLGLQKIKLEQDYIPPQAESEIKLEQDYIPPQTESDINIEPLNASDEVVAEVDNLETDTHVVQNDLIIEPEVMNELPSPEITSEMLQLVFVYLDIPSLRSCRLVDSVWKDAATQVMNKKSHQAADLTNDGLVRFLLQCPEPQSLPFNRFKMSLSDSSMNYADFVRFFSKYGSCMKHLELNTESKFVLKSCWDISCMAKLKMLLRHTRLKLKSLVIQCTLRNSGTKFMSELREEDRIAAKASNLQSLYLNTDLAKSRDFMDVILALFPTTRTLYLISSHKNLAKQIPSFSIQKNTLRELHLPKSYFLPASTFWPFAEAQLLQSLSICILTETEEDKHVYESFLASQADTLLHMSLALASPIVVNYKVLTHLVQLPRMLALTHLTFTTTDHPVHPIQRQDIENVTEITLPSGQIDCLPLAHHAVFPKVKYLAMPEGVKNGAMHTAGQIIQVGRWFPNLKLLNNLELLLTTNDLRIVFTHLSGLAVLQVTVTQAEEEEQDDINYVLSGFPRNSAWILDQFMVKEEVAKAVLNNIQPSHPGLHSMTSLRVLWLGFKSKTPGHFQIETFGVQMALLRIQALKYVVLEGDFQLSPENALKLTNYHSQVSFWETAISDEELPHSEGTGPSTSTSLQQTSD